MIYIFYVFTFNSFRRVLFVIVKQNDWVIECVLLSTINYIIQFYLRRSNVLMM